MNLGRNRASRLVDELPHPWNIDVRVLSDEDDLMTRLCAEVSRQVQILTGEVLMYKKDFHGIQPAFRPFRRCRRTGIAPRVTFAGYGACRDGGRPTMLLSCNLTDTSDA
jgi:hypothetical protein